MHQHEKGGKNHAGDSSLNRNGGIPLKSPGTAYRYVPGAEVSIAGGAGATAGAFHLQVDDHIHGLANEIAAVHGFPGAIYIIVDIHIGGIYFSDPYTVVMPVAPGKIQR